MEAKGIVKVWKWAVDIALAILALGAFIVLVSDVSDSLALWKVCAIKLAAFAVLYGVFIRIPWCQDNLRELR